jgi:hypothetical protein
MLEDGKTLASIPESIILKYLPNEIALEWTVDSNFPNFDIFSTSVGRKYGHVVEKMIINERFDDLSPSITTEYDAICNDLRIEIKSTRATIHNADKRNELEIEIWEDAASIDMKDRTKYTSAWQQVKPTYCDYFIFHILFKDDSRYFIVPSRCISSTVGDENPDTFRLGNQHPSSLEGIINPNVIAAKNSHIFEISNSVRTLQEAINIVEERLKVMKPIIPKKGQR